MPMTLTMLTPEQGHPVPVPCVRFPGHRPGEYIHPEGKCSCFHGGPGPVRALSELDHRLRQAAQTSTARQRARRPHQGRRHP
jgi:hypothetical protein